MSKKYPKLLLEVLLVLGVLKHCAGYSNSSLIRSPLTTSRGIVTAIATLGPENGKKNLQECVITVLTTSPRELPFKYLTLTPSLEEVTESCVLANEIPYLANLPENNPNGNTTGSRIARQPEDNSLVYRDLVCSLYPEGPTVQDKTAEPSSSIDKRNAPRTSKRDTGTITSASKAQHSIHPPSLRRSLSLIAYTKSQLTTQARHERGEYDRPSITENWYTTKKAVSQRNWGPKCKSIFTRASLNVYESEIAHVYYSCGVASVLVTSDTPITTDCESVLQILVPTASEVESVLVETCTEEIWETLMRTVTCASPDDPPKSIEPAVDAEAPGATQEIHRTSKTIQKPQETIGDPPSPTGLSRTQPSGQEPGDIVIILPNGQQIAPGQTAYYQGHEISVSSSGISVSIDGVTVDAFHEIDISTITNSGNKSSRAWAIRLPNNEYMFLSSPGFQENGHKMFFSPNNLVVIIDGSYSLPLGPETIALPDASQYAQKAAQTTQSLESDPALSFTATGTLNSSFSAPTNGSVMFQGEGSALSGGGLASVIFSVMILLWISF